MIMVLRSLLFIGMLVALWPASAEQPTVRKNVCFLLDSAKRPKALLMGVDRTLLQGPIRLGDLRVGFPLERERVEIKTDYLVAISPGGVEVENIPSDGWVIQLMVQSNICKNAKLYRVVLIWNFSKNEVRPYEFSGALPRLMLYDSKTGYDNDVSDAYDFQPFLSGRMVD